MKYSLPRNPPDCHHEARTSHRCHFGYCVPCRQVCGQKLSHCDHSCPVVCHTAVLARVQQKVCPARFILLNYLLLFGLCLLWFSGLIYILNNEVIFKVSVCYYLGSAGRTLGASAWESHSTCWPSVSAVPSTSSSQLSGKPWGMQNTGSFQWKLFRM